MQGTVSAKVRQSDDDAKEAWLKPVSRLLLAVFIALPTVGYLAPRWAGRLTWTVVVAGLPLFIVVVGYHRWRRICPLAWFAQLAAATGHPGERRASRWLQANYYYLSFAVLASCLWLRLVASNGHGGALATFLVLLSLGAVLFGAAYTGKSWCNYVCPVSVVEKIYTEPRGMRPTANSQCEKCTACKPACPDINQENGYWKEVASSPKRFAYFAFPGLVFSFYLYFYLQSGNWNYYFGGSWTNEPAILRTAFLPGYDAASAGFFFLPSWPRALAAFVTLAVGVLLSFSAFAGAERLLRKRGLRRDPEFDTAALRHTLLTVAGFVAFVTFYSFAGAPTIRLVPGAPYLMQILVVATATLALARRFTRRQHAFAEETLARQIIRRWEWADMKPPSDLHEAFLIHKIRSQTDASGYARLLETYKEAVREAVATGFLSRAEVQRLESLRQQLRISQPDHERIMADLDEEERARITDPALHVSAEKRLQLDAYAQALRNYLGGLSVGSSVPDDSVIRHVRQEYAVTPEEHAAVLAQLLAGADGTDSYLAQAFGLIENSLRTIHLLRANTSPAGDFLAQILLERCQRAVEGLMRGFGCAPDDERAPAIREGLLAPDAPQREAAVEALGATVAPAIAARLKDAHRGAAREAAAHQSLQESLRSDLASSAPYARTAALYVLHERDGVDEETLTGMIRDDHEVVRETALRLLFLDKGIEPEAEQGLITLEKMIALRAVPLFASLAPEDLACLARAGLQRQFAPNDVLCLEGEPGDEVFVLLTGDVVILRRQGDEQKVVAREQAGGFVGEMAVIDPAPRAATVVAGLNGASALCVDGAGFRNIVEANPSVARGVMRALSARIRGTQAAPRAANAAPAAVRSASTADSSAAGR